MSPEAAAERHSRWTAKVGGPGHIHLIFEDAVAGTLYTHEAVSLARRLLDLCGHSYQLPTLPGPPFTATVEYSRSDAVPRLWITVPLNMCGCCLHKDGTKCGHGLDFSAAQPDDKTPANATRVPAPLLCNAGREITGWSGR